MSTNVNTVTNHYPSPQNGFTTTTSGSVGSGAATVGLNSVAGYTNGQIIVLVIDPTDASKKQTFTGVVDTAGVQVTGVKWTAGTNQTHALGATVVDYATATHISMITKGLLSAGLTQAGGMGAITPTSITSSGTITAANFVQTGGADSSGWTVGFGAPDTVAANGNRSYTLTYNATDKTSVVSAGMRLRTERTVSAPTQCTSLNGTTQYYSKSSPAGMTFTGPFAASAWVKLSSYSTGMIVSRTNNVYGWYIYVENGKLAIAALNGSLTNIRYLITVQSIPINQNTHVAFQLDLGTFTSSPTTNYIMIDGVDVPISLGANASVPTAVTQAGNLEVGTSNGGSNFFPGKIAQVAIYNAKVPQATIKASMNQGLTGSETSLISAYPFNGNSNDLSANANNLTANGSAVATNADSPFGTQASGLIDPKLDYAIIQSATFSTNTTLTVQVPAGNTIPTSGGVAAVSYSTQKAPYGMPLQKRNWQLRWRAGLAGSGTGACGGAGAYWSGSTNGMNKIKIPVGAWGRSYSGSLYADLGGTANSNRFMDMSSVNNAADANAMRSFAQVGTTSANSYFAPNLGSSDEITLTAATDYYLLCQVTGATNNPILYDGDMTITPSYL